MTLISLLYAFNSSHCLQLLTVALSLFTAGYSTLVKKNVDIIKKESFYLLRLNNSSCPFGLNKHSHSSWIPVSLYSLGLIPSCSEALSSFFNTSFLSIEGGIQYAFMSNSYIINPWVLKKICIKGRLPAWISYSGISGSAVWEFVHMESCKIPRSYLGHLEMSPTWHTCSSVSASQSLEML